MATGHARRRPDQHPAHVRNVPSAVQPGGGRGRRGQAGRGRREKAESERERREGAGTPDQGHRKGKTTSAKLFIFPKAMQSAGGGGEGAGGCGAARASWFRKCDSFSPSVITAQERERGFLLFHRQCCWFGPEKEKENSRWVNLSPEGNLETLLTAQWPGGTLRPSLEVAPKRGNLKSSP